MPGIGPDSTGNKASHHKKSSMDDRNPGVTEQPKIEQVQQEAANTSATDNNLENLTKKWEEISRREIEMKTKEKKIPAAEKAIGQRERDLDRKTAQQESSKACLLAYEAKIRDISEHNKLLQQACNPTLKHMMPSTSVWYEFNLSLMPWFLPC